MEKMFFSKWVLLSGGLLSAALIFLSICTLSRIRLSPKNIETSNHGGQGLLTPFHPTFSSFVNFFP